MEKDRKVKVIVLTTLVLVMIGISIGFAAFSNTLTISSDADVTPESSAFNVDFSSASGSVVTDEIVPVTTPTGLTASNAIINNSGDPSISNLSVTFVQPGQKVVYAFYSRNAGEYDSYLNEIKYGNVVGKSSPRVCTAGTGTTDSLVQAACDDIVVKVKVGSEAETDKTVTGISNHKLEKNSSEVITITLEYLSNGDRADGDFSVDFGDITLSYSSID